MPQKINPELRARAVRLVREHRGEYPTLTAACLAVAKQLGVGKETVRRWVAQAEVDVGQVRADVTVGPPARRQRQYDGLDSTEPTAHDHGPERAAQSRGTSS